MRTVKIKKPFGYWSKARVLQGINERIEKGLSLAPIEVAEDDSGLYASAWNTYGSWKSALLAAGVAPDSVYLLSHHDTEQFGEYIKQAYEKGADISDTTVHAFFPHEHRAVTNKYQSWAAYLESLGIEPSEVKRQDRWTKETLHEYLQRAVDLGIDLKALAKLNQGLYRSAKIHFGSFAKAAQSVGYKPRPTNLRRTWTKDLIMEAVQKAESCGISLQSLVKYDSGLRHAIDRQFGSVKLFKEELQKNQQ